MRFNLRTIAGYLVAPLVPGLGIVTVVLIGAITGGAFSPGDLVDAVTDLVVVEVFVLVTLSAYGTTSMLGIPIYRCLQRWHRLAWIDFVLCGLVIGTIAYPLSTIGIFLGKGAGLDVALAWIWRYALVFWSIGMIGGMLGGAVFWMIARPDRAAA